MTESLRAVQPTTGCHIVSLREKDIDCVNNNVLHKYAEKAALKSPVTLLDLRGNCVLNKFQGLKTIFPALQTLVLSENVLGESTSWGAALAKAAPSTLQRLDISSNNLSIIPWSDIATIKLFELILNNNKLTWLGDTTAAKGPNPLPLAGSMRILSVKGNRISSLEGIEIFENLDTFDVRDNLVASLAQLAPLHSLNQTLQSIRLEGNPCMTGEFCQNICWRSKLLLEWTPKVVLLNGLQVPSKLYMRRAFCSRVGSSNLCNGSACPCGLTSLDDAPSELPGKEVFQENVPEGGQNADADVKIVKSRREEVEGGVEEEDIHPTLEIHEPLVSCKNSKLKPETLPDRIGNSSSGTKRKDTQIMIPSTKVAARAVNISAVTRKNSLHEEHGSNLCAQPVAFLPNVQNSLHAKRVSKKEGKSFSTKLRPYVPVKEARIRAAVASSPRKQKQVVKSLIGVSPFAEKRTGTFRPLMLERGARGIGTAGAMPFRKLGERRVARPVKRGYKMLKESTWLSEMLEKAKSKRRGKHKDTNIL